MKEEINLRRVNSENDFVVLKKVRDGGVRGGLWVQEAEKRQGLLWDAVGAEGGQVSLRPACPGVFPKCWGPDLKQ